MTEKRKSILLASLITYSTLISLLVAFGVNHDQVLDKATSVVSVSSDGTHFLNYATILIIIYYLRSGALLIPLWFRNQKWQLVTKVGLGCSFIPELFVLVGALNLVASSGEVCSGPGPFSSCGWSFLIFIPIAISIALQVAGMLAGLVVACFKK